MQRLEHIAEFIDRAKRILARAVSLVWRKERNRLIAPVVDSTGRAILRIKLKHRKQFHRSDAQCLQIRNLLDQPGICSTFLFGNAGAWMSRETTNVHLVDDRARAWRTKRRVALPVVRRRVNHDGLHRNRGVVSLARRCGAIVVLRNHYAAPIRVKQNLRRVEAQATTGIKFDASRGLRFDPAKVLLDPYGRGVMVPKNYDRAAATREGDNAAVAMKSIVVDPSTYDWQGDAPLRTPCARTIIYEMHVRGFTRHPSSGIAEKKRGTYTGLIEKIPYLQALGITAVELLPVFQFDAQDCPAGRINYWGYQPVSFFSPHQAYSSRQDPLGSVDEFRDMLKALHPALCEVILVVVYNHT